MSSISRCSAVLLTWLLCHTPPVRSAPADFTREVRPILSRHCFKCHGPDDKARKAKLRLDVRESAIGEAKSGERPIVPGKPDESELVRRIFAAEDRDLMPPPSSKNPLTDAQKQVLKRWIAEGAEYRQHWAFVPPRQAPLPKVKQSDWPRNAIDHFVLARLEAEGLQPSAPADKYTLVRRLYLDLIGLPPTPEEADAFVQDRSPAAYERLVDRLLASPHYGERWARRWLDLARYADTNGYEKDRMRSIWPYRDWVINTLNQDMPFDQFTIEQLAGDMLPGATVQQRIATGFHRNTMLNEEGGIDPLEFRFYAMTDRVGTTGTVWLGLTVGCAQCHTHKFDPIAHREYYQLMAFLNNADEPVMDIPRPDLAARRAELDKQIAARLADLPNRFPPDDNILWRTPSFVSAESTGGATAEKLGDGSIRFSGKNPERDTYTIVLDTDWTGVTALRLEALADPALPSKGPGRTPHGNFVLSEIAATAGPRNAPNQAAPVKFVRAEANFAQDGFPVTQAIDGNPKTGWAIQGPGQWNVNRAATFTLEKAAGFPQGTRWTIRLSQQHGSQHTLGRLRLSLGQPLSSSRPIAVRRRENLEQKFKTWVDQEAARAVHWTMLRPREAKGNVPHLSILDDGSVLAGGDQTKRDVYDLKYGTDLKGITALRLEVLPHPSLPREGPGRVYYEGAPGDFFLSDLSLTAGGKPVQFSRASQSHADGGNVAANAIDSDPHTGWSINGGQGQAHAAVFNLATPLADARELNLRMVFERYYASGLGRFRISVTTDVGQVSNLPAEKRQVKNLPHIPEAHGLPAEIEELLLVPAAKRSPHQRDQLLQHYLSIASELAGEREAIKKLREQMPAYPTTLVLAERPPDNPRATTIHRRGEFLQSAEPVEPNVLSVLPALPKDTSHNRLTFARWLVDSRNPLVGRVAVNRQWAAFFGRGIVRTLEDFGYQGDPPSHPELLDWLAVEFVKQNWSIKKVQRLIVTSATYQQSSQATPELLVRDPQNVLLVRGPRFRIEGELVRDAALRIAGLLSEKVGGPSVFPPQPPGVTSEGAYGALAWKVSEGQDRYRRGLYTFSKRTAPYAMFNTFDAPSGEACVARREVSNTPLQALTLLNDPVFEEVAQTLGRQTAAQKAPLESQITQLFRRCLTRPPTAEEQSLLMRFYEHQKQKCTKREVAAAKIAGPGEGHLNERAAWTLVARTLMNLDETIAKD